MKFVFHLVTGSFFAFAKFADENFIFFHKERTTFLLSQIPVFLKVHTSKNIPKNTGTICVKAGAVCRTEFLGLLGQKVAHFIVRLY